MSNVAEFTGLLLGTLVNVRSSLLGENSQLLMENKKSAMSNLTRRPGEDETLVVPYIHPCSNLICLVNFCLLFLDILRYQGIAEIYHKESLAVFIPKQYQQMTNFAHGYLKNV